MKAIVITQFGGPEVLELRDVPSPLPSRGEVRVRVRATAVNRADLLQRMGAYPAPAGAPKDIPGLEYAGEVDALGEDVTELAVGDRVFGLTSGGAYAEQVIVHAREAVRMPANLSFIDAAAIPEAFITAYDAMVTRGRLASGERVLISAVGSGVGTAAVQLVKALGATSVGTARTEDKLARAKALGLDEGIVPKGATFADAVRERTNGEGVDLVLELVGGAYVAEDLACVRAKGRVVLVGLMAGVRADIDLGMLLRKRVELSGTVLRARPLEEKIAAARSFERHVVPLFAAGKLASVVDRTLPLAQASRAHEVVASNETFGKVVLVVQ